MILIVTSKEDLTADYLIIRLMEKGFPYFRLNTEDFPLHFDGSVIFPENAFIIKDEVNNSINSEQISGIWYRRPKMLSESSKISTEIMPYVKEDSWFFVNGLLELANDSTRWVSFPEKIRRAENKIYQLKVANQIGLIIPKTFIGNSPDGLTKLIDSSKLAKYNLIAKPLRSGRYFLKEETKIFYTNVFPHDDWNADEIKVWPIMIQENISKKREIRATIFNDKIFSVEIDHCELSEKAKLDWRRDIDKIQYKEITLPSDISSKLHNMLNIMGLSFGAFDLIETIHGEYVFLEVNPNGQWAWIEQKTGLPMRDALIQYLIGEA